MLAYPLGTTVDLSKVTLSMWYYSLVPTATGEQFPFVYFSVLCEVIHTTNGASNDYLNPTFEFLVTKKNKLRRTLIFQRSSFCWSTTKSSFIGDGDYFHGIIRIGFEHRCMILLIGTGVNASAIAEEFVASQATGYHIWWLPFNVYFTSADDRKHRWCWKGIT